MPKSCSLLLYLGELESRVIAVDGVQVSLVVRGILGTRLIAAVYDKVTTLDLFHNLDRHS